MKVHLKLIVVFLFSFDFLIAQSLYVNAIGFKGQSEQNRFTGFEFDIKFDDGNFSISQHKKSSKEFVIKRNDDSIQDLVFSSDRSVIAAAMRATDSKSHKRRIVTIDAHGKLRAFDYDAYKMTGQLGWVVELGAVSNDGTCVLAKCALVLPENEAGISHVRHEWTVLKISDTSIEIVDSVNAIEKWHSYAYSRVGSCGSE